MEKRNLVVWLGICAIAASILFYLFSQDKELQTKALSEISKPEDINETVKKSFEEKLKTFFDKQKSGTQATELFCIESKAVEFFALRNWEIVASPNLGEYTVRVDSSNKAGMAITKLWKITLIYEFDKKAACILGVEDAQ